MLILLSNVIFVQETKASHSMGADLTYQSLGGNTYKITLSFYRDCIGIPAPTNPFVNINSASCGQSLGVTCYPRPGTGQEITPACSSSVTTCNGGSFTGIQEWVYDGIITLPMQCTDWVFSYNLCCRNAAITTITTPGSSTFYIYATLNNTVSPYNNSPTFSNKPVPFLCVGQQYCFNHGAYDADGDSLAYTLITPKQTSGTTVHYIAPYNAANPLNSSPATTFNPFTGDICLTPQALQVTVMAVLVSEYRNGVLIGSVERDMQLTVMNCNNNLPTLTGINGTNNFSMTVCAGQPFCFDIFSNDVDTGQTLTVTWDNGIPGGTFTTSGGPHPTGTFCWTPGVMDISATPHNFTVRVADNACPYIGSQIYSYSITVIGITANAGPDQDIACSDLATLTATGSGGSGVYSYLWSNGSTMQSITVGTGTYTVTVNDGTCSATDTVVVAAPFTPTAAFAFTNSNCTNQSIHFVDQSTTPGGVLNEWHWDLGDGTTSTIQNPIHLYSSPGNYNVTLIVGNTLGCYDTIVQVVDINPPPVVGFSAPNACVGQSVNFTDTSSFGEHLNFWNWNLGDSTLSNSQSPNHIYTTAGTFNVVLIAGDSLGCRDTAYRMITIFPVPVINAGPDQTICAGNSATLTASGGNSYNWTTGDTSSVITVSPGSTTNYNLTVADANGCIAIDAVTVIVNPLPTVNAGPDQNICTGNAATLTAVGGTSYSWSPGGYTSSSISVSPGTNTTYTVTITDANGCTATDQVNVNLNSLPVAVVSSNADICSGSSATLTASGGSSYTWIPTGSSSSSISVSPLSNSTYTVVVTDGNGCSDSASVNVTVHTAPVVNLQSFFLCSGAVATLDAGNAGATYLWSPNGETSQVININSGGTYSVTVTDPYGCSTNAAVNIATGASIAVNLGNISFCQGDSAILDAGHPGMTYLWNPTGETSQSIVVHSSGTYGVIVTDSLGCSGSITANAQVNPLPVANFTASNECVGNATVFTDASNVASGSIQNWSWNFGDGNISTQQNPSHTYTSPGTYNVTLTISSLSGCANSVIQSVTVNPLPVPDFNFTSGCQNSAVTFADNSTVSPGNITGYSWNFGDGTVSSAHNPSHQYPGPGNYNVTLQVTTAGGCSGTLTKTVTVYPLPVAGFSASVVCLGNPTVFTNTSSISTGSITGYNWDFGDSHTSSSQNPSHSYTSAGTYNVSLNIVSNNGCTSSIILPVTVNALPVADAGINQVICTGSNATLTATGGISYNWSPGNSSNATITVTPANSTTYTVTVTDINGCQSSDQVTVNVNSLPNANAGADQSVCAGNSATLHASGGLTYSWNPGGSTNSTISVTPAVTTDYIVTITDVNGCTDRDTARVTVHALPFISAGPDLNICNGSTVSIAASGGNSYTWYPGGSTTSSILVTPSSSMSYIVVGVDVNGCQVNDTMNITVNNTPVVNIPTTLLCTGYTATLDAGNTGSIYSWSTGDNTQSITVTDSGNYSVLVTNAAGCSALGSVNVIMAGSFVTNPTVASICSGQSTTLNAGNPGCSYLWNTGETTQSIQVTTGGVFQVVVTDPNGCSVTVFSNVTLNPNPVGDFRTTPACLGTNSVFTDSSTISSGTIQNYNWSFGDGYSSSLRNPVHHYLQTGTYQVTLTITSANGCTSTVTKPAVVNTLPVADYSNTTVCLGQQTSFTDLSSLSTGSISTWNWSFGDGNHSGLQNPSNIYGTAGNFTASLTVTSPEGCTATSINSIVVKGLPVAAFSATNSCVLAPVQFNNVSYSMNGTITGYSWNFGNGTTSSLANPVNAFSADGNYVVQLTVTSSLGCVDTITQPVTIYPLPDAAFATTPVCENSSAAFINNSTVTSGSVTSLYWNFGDGSSSNQLNPSHAFLNSGVYNITLIATTNFQCSDTINQNLAIYPIPVAGFDVQDVCVNALASFVDSSSVSSGSLSTWSWNFGDGSSSSSNNPSHTYTNPGTYTVSLTVTSNNGCSNTIQSGLNIFPDPVAEFTGISVCLSNATQFFNQSYIAGGSSYSSAWDFNDGSASTQNNPVHTYTTPGNYNVVLTVTSGNGCSSQVNHHVNVYLGPTVSFTANNGCLGIQTVFTDNSSATDGMVSSWDWNFGDGTNSNSNAPVHTYANSGNYNVTLTTTTSYGCYNTSSGNVQVYELPSPAILSNDVCLGSSIDFADISATSSITQNYLWDFGDGNIGTDSAASHLYMAAGTYQVTLVAINSNNCYASDITFVSIYPEPDMAFSAGSVCENSPTQFNNTSAIGTGSIINYSWNFGDGSGGSSVNPSHTYPAPGIYTATLSGMSDFGCTSSDTQMVKINPNPQVTFGSAIQGCSPLHSTFNDSSWISQGSIIGWLWDFGDGNVSTQQNPSHVYMQPGTFPVTLTVVSNEGCQTSVTEPGYITVYPQPLADFSADPTSTDMVNPVIQFTNLSQSYSAFAWNFSDGTSNYLVSSPAHMFTGTGNFSAQLIVMNSYGCRDTAYKTIEVFPHSTLFAPNCFTPNGDGKNDVFKPAYTEMSTIQVWIFNRWGELLKNWDGLEGYWDGYYQGRACQEDVYVYKIKGLGDDGKNYEWVGHVSIVH
ncbi:MAG: PKD domain-containing protein [Bacteroidetes bacterium]|nr:PKD domain-containing protein [Bacteroidota bacterium]